MKRLAPVIFVILCCLTALPSYSARSAAEKDYRFAEGLQKRGLNRTAASEYVAFLKKYPDHEWAEYAYYNLGVIYKEMGDEEKGIKAWEMLQEKYKDSQSAARTYYQIAEMYLDRGSELMGDYDRKKDAALKEQALAYFEKSAVSYDNYLKKNGGTVGPDNVRFVITALFNIASCYERLQAYSKAVKVYEKLVKDYNDYEAQFKIGDVYLQYAKATADPISKQRYYLEAIQGFRKTLLFGYTELYDDAKIGFANVLIQQGKYAQARETLMNEINLKDISKGKFERIYTEFRTSDKVDAIFLKYLAPRAYWMIADCYEKEGNPAEAKNWYNLIVESAERNPRIPELVGFKGAAQKKLRELYEKENKGSVVNTIQVARATLDIAKNFSDTNENAKAINELYRIRRGFQDLNKADFYNEYLYTLAYACYSEKRYLEAGIVGEYLGRRLNPAEMVDSPEGKVPRLGQALYYAGSSYWEYSTGITAEKAKAFFELLAVSLFERMAKFAPTHPKSPEVQRHAAGYYLKIKDYAHAALNYDAFLTKQSNPNEDSYSEALYNLAYCYLSLEQHDKAEKEYSKYVSLYDKKRPNTITAIDLLGGCLIREGKYSDAINVFMKLKPEDFKWVEEKKLNSDYKSVFEDAHYQMGFSYYMMKDFDKAIKEYAYFIDSYPDNPKVPGTRLLLAQLYFDKDDHQNVVKVLGDFIAKHSNTPEAYKGYILLTESYLKTRNTEKALETETEMFKIYGKEQLTEGSYGRMAKIMKDADCEEGAMMAYQELITDYKDEPKILARALWASAEFAFETMKKFEKAATNINDDQAKAKNAQEQKDYLSIAANHYEEYLKVATKNLREETGDPKIVPSRWFELQFRIGEIHERLAEYDAAEKAYNQVAAQSTDNAKVVEAQYRIGNMWLKANDPKKALGTYLRLIFMQDNKNPEIRKWIALATFEAGVAFQRNKEPDKARKMITDFLKEYKEPEFNNLRGKAEELLKEI